MPTYDVRTYGAMDFQVTAKTLRSAKAKLNKMFNPFAVDDPLIGVPISPDGLVLGYSITHPERTRRLTDATDLNDFRR